MTSNARCQGKPEITENGILCSCGNAMFKQGSPESRAAAYLAHRRGTPVSATEAFFWAEGNKASTVPDDKPPLCTVTVFLMPTGRTNAVLGKVENAEWKDGVLHVYQADGTEWHYPKHIVHHVTVEEGAPPPLTDEQDRRRDEILRQLDQGRNLENWQVQMNQRLDNLGPLEPGI